MQKITLTAILIVLASFWAYPCQAETAVYFAPDGSQITKAEHDRLAAEKADAYQRSKKAGWSSPLKKSNRLAAKAPSKAASNQSQPKPSHAPRRSNVSEIRESDIRNIARKIVQSANNRDLNGVIAYLAPTYRVTLKTPQGDLSLTRDEYVTFLRDGWSVIGYYKSRIDTEKITIAPNKQKATHEAKIMEVTTLTNGASLKVRSHQTSIYEIVNGKILITSTEAREEHL